MILKGKTVGGLSMRVNFLKYSFWQMLITDLLHNMDKCVVDGCAEFLSELSPLLLAILHHIICKIDEHKFVTCLGFKKNENAS